MRTLALAEPIVLAEPIGSYSSWALIQSVQLSTYGCFASYRVDLLLLINVWTWRCLLYVEAPSDAKNNTVPTYNYVGLTKVYWFNTESCTATIL